MLLISDDTYKNIFSMFGKYKGFRKSLKIEEIYEEIKNLEFKKVKYIIVEIECKSDVSLFSIADILETIDKNPNIKNNCAFSTIINDELNKGEIIFQILFIED